MDDSGFFGACFRYKKCAITLIESEDIGTVGLGEATLPHLRFFNKKLGIDERDFMRRTESTYKMGIEFVNWGKLGDAYIHPFGDYGDPHQKIPFHHLWLKAKQAGLDDRLCEYSLPVKAAAANKFEFPSDDKSSVLSTFSYAYHVDAGLYAKYLREYSQNKGVERIEGKIAEVSQAPDSGYITSVSLPSGQTIEADFFIDCSGFRGLLIEQTLNTGYQDWSHWLQCDSAQAVGCERSGPLLPYSRATAQTAGWQWRIPLRHRTGNGYVYASDFIEDEEVTQTLLQNLDGKPLNSPIQLRFKTGKRNKVWHKNCVAIGLSSGFLEPLESTSIYLIQEAITNLIALFPDNTFDDSTSNEFNRIMDAEYQRIRDFLILHYHATERDDTPFWNYVRQMSIPDSLQHKMDLFKQQGHIVQYKAGLFLQPSWLAVYAGQRITPRHYHPSIAGLSDELIVEMLRETKSNVAKGVQAMAGHEQPLSQYLDQNSTLTNRSEASASLYSKR